MVLTANKARQLSCSSSTKLNEILNEISRRIEKFASAGGSAISIDLYKIVDCDRRFIESNFGAFSKELHNAGYKVSGVISNYCISWR